jgi:hypothetical protein
MARHEVTMSLPKGVVINADVVFVVASDGLKLGELRLSKGTVDWRPAHAKKIEYRVGWERFAEVMQEHGRTRRLP